MMVLLCLLHADVKSPERSFLDLSMYNVKSTLCLSSTKTKRVLS